MRIYSHILSPEFVNFWEVPNLLLQKFPAEEFTATTKLKVSAKDDGQMSGLIVMGWDYAYLGVEKSGEGFILKYVQCKDAEQKTPEKTSVVGMLDKCRTFEAGLYPNYEIDIYLRVKIEAGGKCSFYYSTDGKRFHNVCDTFIARQGKWIGAKVGLFSVAPYGKERGWVDADWFRIN